MFINEIVQGTTVKISVKIKNEESVFSSFVFYVFDGCILVSKITRNGMPIDFKGHKVDISYVSPYDKETYIFKDCNIKLVKYKENTYHHISTNMSSVQKNRRRSYRQYLGIEGVVKVPNSTTAALINDISDSGCAFISTKDFSVGDSLSIMFKDGPYLFDEKIRVVRIHNRENNFLYGCEFFDKNTKLTEYIKYKQKELVNC